MLKDKLIVAQLALEVNLDDRATQTDLVEAENDLNTLQMDQVNSIMEMSKAIWLRKDGQCPALVFQYFKQ